MKTPLINSQKGTNKANNSAFNAKAENNGTEVKNSGLSQPNGEITKPEVQLNVGETPKAEPTKTDITEEVQQKPVLNLEGTLKLVEELHRRKIQRDRLLETIDLLEAFEVAQQEDAEETDSNHFQGCVLTIEDDERRKFSTKNPVIINAVAQFVNKMCVERLTEIEAGITIPS
jgi:hypothetical protein